MAVTTYRTVDGDRIDLICYNHYGHLTGTVEAVLDANQGLAAHGETYSAGIAITLPEIAPPGVQQIKLWVP